MITDLARDEDIAAALPRDFVADLRSGKYGRNVCEDCRQIFKGRLYRTLCAVCAPKKGPDVQPARTA